MRRKLLTLAGGSLVIAAFIFVALGERVRDRIAQTTGQSSPLIDVLVSGRLGAALLLFVAVAGRYRFAPDVPRPPRWVLPGTVVVAVASLAAFVGFDVLVRLADPGSAFGAAGAVLVLLWLLCLERTFVVAGALLNAVLSDRYDGRLNDYYLRRHPDRRVPPQV